MRDKTLVTSALTLFLTVMLLLVGPFAPVSRTYAASADATPNPAFLGSFVTVSGSGFQPNCGPPGSGAPCILVIVFAVGGGFCGPFLTDQLGIGGSGIGVLGFGPSAFPSFGNLFFVTTDKYGAFSLSILLDSAFSATNYSILAYDGTNAFCIDPFTVVLQVCVIQLGVEQPAGVVSWLPGYAYPDLLPSSCPDVTERYVDGSGVHGGMIVVHQFVQNRTYFTETIARILVA